MKKSQKKKKSAKLTCGCGPKCSCATKHHTYDMPMHEQTMGLNDMEQDTQVRGCVPNANQPDHTGNLWKTDQSQTNDSCDGSSYIHSYEADIHTPMREKVVALGVMDSSNMHIISRFGCEQS